MNEPYLPPTGWRAKFANALRGVQVGVWGESSFAVHLPMAGSVLALAFWLKLDAPRISLLVLCVFAVWSAELFNSSIEQLAKAVDTQENPHLRDALDVASGAVLCAAVGAALVGAGILAPPLLDMFLTPS